MTTTSGTVRRLGAVAASATLLITAPLAMHQAVAGVIPDPVASAIASNDPTGELGGIVAPSASASPAASPAASSAAAGCGSPSPVSSPTPSPVVSSSPASSPSASPASSPVASGSPSPATSSGSASASPAPSGSPSAAGSGAPSGSPSPAASAASSATPSRSSSPAASASGAPSAAATASPAPSATPCTGPSASPAAGSASPKPSGSASPNVSASPTGAVALTIGGPATVHPAYGSTFTITGTAPVNATVSLHFHKAGSAAGDYSIVRTTNSDDNGNWTRAITANVDYRYYATVDSATSETDLNQPADVVDGPASRVVPVGTNYTLTGGGSPGTTVYLHFHAAGTSERDYSIIRSVGADANGSWSRTFVASRDYRIFVSRDASSTAGDGIAHYLVQAR